MSGTPNNEPPAGNDIPAGDPFDAQATAEEAAAVEAALAAQADAEAAAAAPAPVYRLPYAALGFALSLRGHLLTFAAGALVDVDAAAMSLINLEDLVWKAAP